MPKQELVQEITERFKNGESRQSITEILFSKGYSEEEINQAISRIRHEHLMQIPWVKNIVEKWIKFEKMFTDLNPQESVMVLIATLVCLVALWFILSRFVI